jgi:hypothetical protein
MCSLEMQALIELGQGHSPSYREERKGISPKRRLFFHRVRRLFVFLKGRSSLLQARYAR